ncbi:MAG: hypothetical protein OSB29_08250 [Verrucomicrobiota bacterium]|nr:hypothetical protein [Verrucomicrobiota bacterium]
MTQEKSSHPQPNFLVAYTININHGTAAYLGESLFGDDIFKGDGNQ